MIFILILRGLDTNFKITQNHPRFDSIMRRHNVVEGCNKGITALAGLIAQGRGEAFDYLLGEQSSNSAIDSVKAASALLLLAKRPVVSVNGNSVVLVPKENIELAALLNAPLEVNLFYRTKKREKAIKKFLLKHGANKKSIYGVNMKKPYHIKELEHSRGIVDPRGIKVADVVIIPLEDGDRTIALKNLGKKVIAIDLNPFSRTPNQADISIIDNITRAFPLLIKTIKEFKEKNYSQAQLEEIVNSYDKNYALKDAFNILVQNLQSNVQKENFS